ncbi:hypothetical protein QYE76_033437 [Lolium multiflorum]|uniref:Reverse transcriptase Ty1/copia-type domain-containing protein n=1 Tax=Lolium multiflorum TaxID=4521 RepID=A0AAD8QYQ2_LOLMU|nr:hypothetical protein QYE76_033437 [Lolium multiflorum]
MRRRRESHLGGFGRSLRHLPERGFISGGLFIAMIASGVMSSTLAPESLVLRRITFRDHQPSTCFLAPTGSIKPWFLSEGKLATVRIHFGVLKQAPRAWYEHLKELLVDRGFDVGLIDPTLFTKRVNGELFVCQLYVDDIIFGSTNKAFNDEFSKLMTDRFEMSMMGEMKFFLGFEIKQLREGTFINQAKYLQDMLKRFKMTELKGVATPMVTKCHLALDPNGKEVDQKEHIAKYGGSGRHHGGSRTQGRGRGSMEENVEDKETRQEDRHCRTATTPEDDGTAALPAPALSPYLCWP